MEGNSGHSPIGRYSTDLVIDVDRHIVETWNVLRDYADPELRGRLCELLPSEDGGGRIVMGGRPMPFASDMWDDPYANRMFADDRFTPNRILSEGLDPPGYLRTLDQEGIDIALVIPTLSLGNPTIPSGFIGSALSRAYGRWAADFCAADRDRLRLVYPVNLFDIDLAVRDARWAVESLGSTALMVIALPVDGKAFHDSRFDPFWAAVEALGVPLVVHTLSSLPDSEGNGPLVDVSPGVGYYGGNIFLHHLISHRLQQHLAAASFIVGGVLARFPGLKLIFGEAGGSWMQSWVEEMDEHYESEQMRRAVPWLRDPPSEYVRRQCLVAFKPSESFGEGAVGGALPVESVAWASDYPHYDSIPGCVAHLCGRLASLSPEARRKILGGNAARFLGLGPTPSTRPGRVAAEAT
jgi:predicted TIM-barrel fold metal-dependent hydrolase